MCSVPIGTSWTRPRSLPRWDCVRVALPTWCQCFNPNGVVDIDHTWVKLDKGVGTCSAFRLFFKYCNQLSKPARERSDEQRQHYATLVGMEDPQRLISIDETSADLRMTSVNGLGRCRFTCNSAIPFCLWCMVILHMCCFSTKTDFSRFTLLPALSSKGPIYAEIKNGPHNGESFLQYLDNLLLHMNEYPTPHSVLVMDNCSIYHVEGVFERCAVQ